MGEKNLFDRDANDVERLHKLLAEDVDSADDEVLLGLARQMNQWSSPEATPQMTADLMSTLVGAMPSAESRLSPMLRALRQWWPLLLMRTQLRVVRKEIWAASALVMALGTLVAIGAYSPNAGGTIPITIVAPIVAAVGVALLYDSEYEQMLEIENTTLASARLLLLARLTLVFGFNLILGLVGSLLLSVFHADVLLWPLVMSWLGPMVFLSSFAFLLSVAFGDALVGSGFGLLIWGLHVLLSAVPERTRLINILSLPVLSEPSSRPFLFLVAALLITLALWLVGQNERQIGEAM